MPVQQPGGKHGLHGRSTRTPVHPLCSRLHITGEIISFAVHINPNISIPMSINKVILIGNVGRDPEVRYYEPGKAVASLPLATSERGYTLPNGTQVPERTDWHNIILWGKLAETAEKYVHKGDKLYIEGKIRTRSYADQSGAQRYVTEIYTENMEMLSPRPTSPGGAAQASAPSAQPAQTAAPRSGAPASSATAADSEQLPF